MSGIYYLLFITNHVLDFTVELLGLLFWKSRKFWDKVRTIFHVPTKWKQTVPQSKRAVYSDVVLKWPLILSRSIFLVQWVPVEKEMEIVSYLKKARDDCQVITQNHLHHPIHQAGPICRLFYYFIWIIIMIRNKTSNRHIWNKHTKQQVMKGNLTLKL